MSDCAARPRWAAYRRVLSRPDRRAIEAPCVLALHSPIPPARRSSFRFDLLELLRALAQPPPRRRQLCVHCCTPAHLPLREPSCDERCRRSRVDDGRLAQLRFGNDRVLMLAEQLLEYLCRVEEMT